MSDSSSNAGKPSEQKVQFIIDSSLTKAFSFHSPKTKSNAQVTDTLVWFNWSVMMFEVKYLHTSTMPIETWVRDRINEAIGQLEEGLKHLHEDEVYMHNEYFHITYDKESEEFFGIIILDIGEEKTNFNLNEMIPGIYSRKLPIHVFTLADFNRIQLEIDTIADFRYYLLERFKYASKYDIPLGNELTILGFYKLSSNRFPMIEKIDFSNNHWENYVSKYSRELKARREENEYSVWIDETEKVFLKSRRLHLGLPVGLYGAWEFGAMSRRERTVIGKKLASVQDWFQEGNNSRKFAALNGSTGNWIIFYFSNGKERSIGKDLDHLVKLKMYREVCDGNFDLGVYGIGYKVSKVLPPTLMGVTHAIIASPDIVKDCNDRTILTEARSIWKGSGGTPPVRITEFPE